MDDMNVELIKTIKCYRSDASNYEVSEKEKNHELVKNTAMKILSESINPIIENETVFCKIRGR